MILTCIARDLTIADIIGFNQILVHMTFKDVAKSKDK